MTDFHLIDKFETGLQTVKPVGRGKAIILTVAVVQELQALLRYFSFVLH